MRSPGWCGLLAIAIGLSCGTPARRAVPPVVPVATAPAATNGRARVAIDATAMETGKLVVTPEVSAPVAAPSNVTDLAAPRIAALIARLPALPVAAASTRVAARPTTPAPIRAGTVVPVTFQAPTGTAIADSPVASVATPKIAAQLAAPDIEPTGRVPAESEIRVAFDDAMVALAAVGSQAPTPPATITPAVAGTWRWIDTRVAVFTASAGRLPQATEFTVTVAAGTKSVAGAVLTAAVTSQFWTAPIKLAPRFPDEVLRPDSPLAVGFDQPFDPAAIAKFVEVEDNKHKTVPTEVIDLAEAQRRWAKHPAVQASSVPDHVVIIAPKTAWKPGSYHLVLKAGAPSLEGTQVTGGDDWFSFEVAAPFRLLGIACEDKAPKLTGMRCAAGAQVAVTLNNPVDSPTSDLIQIEGEPLDTRVPDGDLTIPRTAPATGPRTFRVVAKPGLVDAYGQALQGPTVATASTTKPGVESPNPVFDSTNGVYVLDPRFTIPQWIVRATIVPSVHIRLYAVQPTDFFAFEQFEAKKIKQPPGKSIVDEVLPVGAGYGTAARIDLRPALGKSGTGHVIAIAEAKGGLRNVAWIQVTRLGLVTRMDNERLDGWVTDLTPGRALTPVANAKTTLLAPGKRTDLPSATSDAEGHVELALPPYHNPDGDDYYTTALAVATVGDDSTFAALDYYERIVREHTARWYVTDDRFNYRPGEHAYFKGWVRWTHDGPNPGLAQPAAGERIGYRLTDSKGTELATGTTDLTAQGGFDLDLALPDTVALGRANLTLTANKQSITHPFAIREFRRPTFQATLDDDVTHGGSLPLVLGEQIAMTVEASYYGGGGLAGAEVNWQATLHPGYYAPPGWPSYSFDHPRTYSDRSWPNEKQHATLSAASTTSMQYGIAALPDGGPAVLSVDAAVHDLDRSVVRASSRNIVVHPSAYYVGLRAHPDNNEQLDVIVTTIDGISVAGVPIDISLTGTATVDTKPVTDTQTCHLTSALAPVVCTYKRVMAGTRSLSYVAEAHITDRAGRPNVTRYDVPSWNDSQSSEPEDLEIVANQKLYRPGDVAKLEIRSRLVPATAVVIVARHGIVSQRRIALTKPSTMFELPIDVSYIHDISVEVDVWASVPGRQATRATVPAYRSAEVELEVDIEAARLVVRPRAVKSVLRPGEPATFEVDVERDGKPVAGAEVALFAVDEGILSLAQMDFADPLRPFFSWAGDGTNAFTSLTSVDDASGDLDRQPGVVRVRLDSAEATVLFGGRGHMRGRTSAVPTVSIGSPNSTAGSGFIRADFRPTAVWAPRLVTDAHGHATTTVTMPDSLTRYRIVALATADTYYFGKGEANVVAQREINVRIAAPRFLTQGDKFSLSVVVQNLEAAPRTVEVALRAGNLAITGATGKQLTLDAGARAEVRFDAATAAAGTAAIQAVVSTADAFDSTQLAIPVYVPASTESFATYGVVGADDPKIERIEVPPTIIPEIGGLEAELSSTQMQSLVDSFWYLERYPYECAEQRSARMLGTTALADILTAFTGITLSPAQLAAERADDIIKLRRAQNSDGGFGYFSNLRSDPYVTAQVLRAFPPGDTSNVKASAQTFVVAHAAETIGELAVRAAMSDAKRPKRSDVEYLVGLAAADLAALSAIGEDVHARALALHKAATSLAVYPTDAKARVLSLLAAHPPAKAARAALLAALLAATHETAAGATVATTYVDGEQLLLGSTSKTNALVLDALLREAPAHAVIPKLARTILDARQGGRWHTTQENLIVIEAMRRYFDVFEKDVPNFTAKLWVGNVAYAEKQFAGRSMERTVAGADWTQLAPGTGHDLAITRTGTGKLYYRLGITYAPKTMPLPPLDAGFVVRRGYQAVDNPGDVTHAAEGTWKIKLGAKVLVVLETVNTTARFAVALADPLAAGLEPVDGSLATSDGDARGTTARGWDFVELRDSRGQAFAMSLPAGTHRFAYTVRATTPGTFLAPPTKAEEMYHPETFGRSSSTVVIVQ